MMNKDEFDQFFDSAFDKVAKNVDSTPDPDLSWTKLEPQLKTRLSRNRINILPYAVAASFLIGVFIVGSPSATKAFTPFFSTIKQLQEDVVSFIFGNGSNHNGKANTEPPPDIDPKESTVVSSGILDERHYTSMEEAGPHLEFTAPEIGYVPEDFTLADLLVFTEENLKSKNAVIIYTNNDKSFMIRIRMLERSETLTSSTDTYVGEFEEVQVNDNKGYLTLINDGRTSLEYMLRNTVISISGNITKEEILKIAENMR
jgi:hypothetical protein